ncbi:MAG: hypothetical protein HRT51_07475 [Colwellia sp.]|nr:hypothetical protein [Colwellia sp.]
MRSFFLFILSLLFSFTSYAAQAALYSIDTTYTHASSSGAGIIIELNEQVMLSACQRAKKNHRSIKISRGYYCHC